MRDTGTARGRGVFADRPFRAGETIETCPVVPLDVPYEELPFHVQRMVFAWPCERSRLRHALALGYGSLYNGANPANLRFERDLDRGLIRFVAVRDIDAGEELTINYSAPDGRAETASDEWFSEQGIRPIFDPSR